jgi:hypothetical protein
MSRSGDRGKVLRADGMTLRDTFSHISVTAVKTPKPVIALIHNLENCINCSNRLSAPKTHKSEYKMSETYRLDGKLISTTRCLTPNTLSVIFAPSN